MTFDDEEVSVWHQFTKGHEIDLKLILIYPFILQKLHPSKKLEFWQNCCRIVADLLQNFPDLLLQNSVFLNLQDICRIHTESEFLYSGKHKQDEFCQTSVCLFWWSWKDSSAVACKQSPTFKLQISNFEQWNLPKFHPKCRRKKSFSTCAKNLDMAQDGNAGSISFLLIILHEFSQIILLVVNCGWTFCVNSFRIY